jgi:hypothetical protein
MNCIRRCLGVLAAFGGALFALAVTAPGALATFDPGPPGNGPAPVTYTVVVGGMPGWQIALIAAATAVVAVLADRAWAGRQRRPGDWLLLDD